MRRSPPNRFHVRMRRLGWHFPALIVFAAVTAGVVVAALELRPAPPGSDSGGSTVVEAAQPVVRTRSGFPAPFPGAVVVAREDGADVLALAIAPRRRDVRVRASLLDQNQHGVRGLSVTFAAPTRSARPVQAGSCGAGCYEATLPGEAPASIQVVVRGGAATTWTVPLPRPWPPADGRALLARATATWTSLHSLAYHDRLASDPHSVAVTEWQIVAPDRVAYQERSGSQAIIVGRRRWDRESASAAWVESPQDPPLHQPVPFWVAYADAHVLGKTHVGGRQAWLVSFFDPKTQAWFQVAVDTRTGRTLRLDMFGAAHFMHDTYRDFNASVPIEPPRG